VDGAVYAECEAAGIWVNSADDPAHCSFILPAVHREGPVSIAVSTGGASPALAAWLRSRIGADFGPGLAELAELLDEERRRLRQAGLPSDAIDWPALLDGGLLALVRSGDLERARSEVARAPRR
jgi:precorrin-2 dehydrogenase/sirohydrochlorin ferrochelatase